MRWMGLNDLRESFSAFFEGKGHIRLPSFSLVPQDDDSLLLINSGMAPMKKYFTGEVTPPSKRVTTCQKCIRTPDIEQVGKTSRHGTYFEMLGNFSFGDYFKREAIAWAWEYCIDVLDLPRDLIWISVYEDDDESVEIWEKEIGVPSERIVRLGKEDNFWEHGSGPCGPCSELHYDRGEEHGCGDPDCTVGCNCDRFVEFWNLVFTQYNSDGKGNYTPLEHPNIDTGLGLERLAAMMQGVNNLFEVDTVQNIMKHIAKIANAKYGNDEKTDVSLRVITDHVRSVTFMIGDGVMPSNESRGYIVRRLLRRAARHGRLLGIERTFLAEVSETVIKENENAYPELKEKKAFIQKIIQVEEEAFGKTIDSGLDLLENMVKNIKGNILSGEDAFKLYDTYGFPVDLTIDILEERDIKVDEDSFDAKMKEQRERARAARKDAGEDAWKSDSKTTEHLSESKFIGYNSITAEEKIVAIISEDKIVDSLADGQEGVMIFAQTPFYPEGGGQAGDTGVISDKNGSFYVSNTAKTDTGVMLHFGKMTKGQLMTDAKVTLSVDAKKRASTKRNHTSAHLLQGALRKILGEHVEQAGQMVDDKRMRFDFSHFSALTPKEIKEIEDTINDWILKDLEVKADEMPIEKAKKIGAMALFGEKYGNVVRVLSIKDGSATISAELCGGTHVENTAKIGLFHIVSESSVAAGVRRIEAITGFDVKKYLDNEHSLLLEIANLLKVGSPKDISHRVTQLLDELKEAAQELASIRSQAAADRAGDVLDSLTEVEGVNIKTATAVFKGVSSDDLRTMSDRLREKADSNVVVVLAGVNDGKVTFAAFANPDAVKAGVRAGDVVREVAMITGGKGGGRPDFAMAGGKDVDKVDEAFEMLSKIIKKIIK